jgi:DNA polymerase I
MTFQFVPKREGDTGALTKYFGKVAGEDEFKVRGIEARQRSTLPFIEDVQRDCLDRLDTTRSPETVLSCLQRNIEKLHAGKVAVERLVEQNRVTKPLESYTQNTQNVAALKRARDQNLAVHPGQNIEYVVVDDEKSSPTRRSRRTIRRTTRHNSSALSKAYSHRSDGIGRTFVGNSPRHES